VWYVIRKFTPTKRWKLNVIKQKSDEQSGLRLQWPKPFALIAIMALSYSVKEWWASETLTSDVFWGVAFVAVVVGVYYTFRAIKSRMLDILFGITVGMIGVIYFLIMPNGTCSQSIYGALLVTAYVPLLAVICLTTWHPPFYRPTRNIREKKDWPYGQEE
jgi:hypothetical protein